MNVELHPDGTLHFVLDTDAWRVEGEFPNQTYYCPKCGKRSLDAEAGAKICPWCGRRVG